MSAAAMVPTSPPGSVVLHRRKEVIKGREMDKNKFAARPFQSRSRTQLSVALTSLIFLHGLSNFCVHTDSSKISVEMWIQKRGSGVGLRSFISTASNAVDAVMPMLPVHIKST